MKLFFDLFFALIVVVMVGYPIIMAGIMFVEQRLKKAEKHTPTHLGA